MNNNVANNIFNTGKTTSQFRPDSSIANLLVEQSCFSCKILGTGTFYMLMSTHIKATIKLTNVWDSCACEKGGFTNARREPFSSPICRPLNPLLLQNISCPSRTFFPSFEQGLQQEGAVLKSN